MEKKPSRIPFGLKVAALLVLIALYPVLVVVFFKLIDIRLTVAFGMVFPLAIWPLIQKFASRRLYAIRWAYIKIVRMNKRPIVPVAQVLGLYALIFSPSLILAFISLILPWGAAMGIFFIPAVFLLIMFGCFHGSVWHDIEWRIKYYVLYIIGLLAVSCVTGVMVNFLLQLM